MSSPPEGGTIFTVELPVAAESSLEMERSSPAVDSRRSPPDPAPAGQGNLPDAGTVPPTAVEPPWNPRLGRRRRAHRGAADRRRARGRRAARRHPAGRARGSGSRRARALPTRHLRHEDARTGRSEFLPIAGTRAEFVARPVFVCDRGRDCPTNPRIPRSATGFPMWPSLSASRS